MKRSSKLLRVRQADRKSYKSASPNAVDIGNNEKGFFVHVMQFENGDTCEYSTPFTPDEVLERFPIGSVVEYEFIKNSNPKYMNQLKNPSIAGNPKSKSSGSQASSIKAQWAVKQAVLFHNENGFAINLEDKEKTQHQQAMNQIYLTAEDLLRIHDRLEMNIKSNKYKPKTDK